MPIDPNAIARFLDQRGRRLPDVKRMNAQQLDQHIRKLTGIYPEWITEPRVPQHQGLALALDAERALLFYFMRMGKALRHDWPVATPQGWRTIGKLHVGDDVLGQDGKPTKVIGVYPQGSRDMYEVTFSDGATTICDAEHIWAVNGAVRRSLNYPWKEVTTKYLAQHRLRNPKTRGYDYFIPMAQAPDYPECDLPLDPYLLGVILGDGGISDGMVSLTTDSEILNNLPLPAKCNFIATDASSPGVEAGYIKGTNRYNPVLFAIREMGLAGRKSSEKFIPPQYLIASYAQRKALLAGLLDTDGWCQNQANVQWGSTSLALAQAMQELIRSFGGTAKIKIDLAPKYTYKGEKRIGQTFYQMSVRLPASFGCPFILSRKAAAWRPFTKFQPQRAIVAVKQVELAQAVCIKVANPNGLFIIKDYVVTHNTKLALDWASHLALSGRWSGKGIVIVPRPILLDVWESQARLHSALRVRCITSTSLDEVLEALDSDAELIIISLSSLQYMFTVKAKSDRGKGPPKLYPDMAAIEALASCLSLAIIDEIHTCKNHLSLRFGIVAPLLQHCQFKLGLTGTAWGRSPFDVWAQAFLIDHGETLGYNYYFFEAAFGVKEMNWASKRKEFKFDKSKMQILQEKLASVSLSYRREELGSATQENCIELELHGDQRDAYEEIVNKMITLPEAARAEIKNTFVRLRQCASGYLPFTDEEGEERVIYFQHNSKLEWLISFFTDLEEDIKVVIFYAFTPSGRRICAELQTLKVKHVWLWSGTRDRAAATRDFQSGKVQVMVVNNQSGDMGVDFSAADYQIFYEAPLSTTVRVQAEQRAQGAARNGRALLIDDMVCAPVEARVLELVREGKDTLAELFRDPKYFSKSLRLPLAKQLSLPI